MRNVILFFGLLLALLPLRAQADCVSDCQAAIYCGDGYWECRDQMTACYRDCPYSGGNGGSSNAYGAIAYGKDSGAWGLSDQSASAAAAEKSALRFCRQHGDDCKIVASFSDTCAAVAEDADGNVGWATADVKKKAMEKAVDACNDKSGGKSCKVSLSNCYSG